MADFKHPGVYVEELPTTVRPIEGVATSTAAFAGTGQQRLGPVLVTSVSEYERTFGAARPGFLSAAVRGFFQNGGKRCHVAIGVGADPVSDALALLEREEFSLLCCPDEDQHAGAGSKLVAFCECRQNIVAILQPTPPLPGSDDVSPIASSYVAHYYPWIVIRSADGDEATVPPGGHVAGALARTDVDRGVQRSPDGARLNDVIGVSHIIEADEADALLSKGINVIRQLPDRGIILFGARTTSADGEWRYLQVRRVLIYLEESIRRGLQWAIFEPNDPALWVNIVRAIEDFLLTQWRHGMLMGAKADAAFFVRCDRTTMTQADLDAGRFVAIVGVAPLRQAEFVILRFKGQTTYEQT